MMGQSYPIYDSTGYNHVRFFIGSSYVFDSWKPGFLKWNFKANAKE